MYITAHALVKFFQHTTTHDLPQIIEGHHIEYVQGRSLFTTSNRFYAKFYAKSQLYFIFKVNTCF